ncbi:MAG: OmpA family protein [Pseudomonadota bacterium]
MWIERRHFLGGGLAAVAIGSAIGLDAIGPVPRPEPLSVQFSRGTSLAQGEDARVAAFAARHLAEPRLQFHITGHTGARGDTEANKALSLQRAEMIAGLLRDAGVDPSSILAVQGVGSADPLAKDSDESDAAHQRRMARAIITTVVRK